MEKFFLDQNIHFTAYHVFKRVKDENGIEKKIAANQVNNSWQKHNTLHKPVEEVMCAPGKPVCGLGLICGKSSNIFVVDFDDMETHDKIMSQFPEDQKTLKQTTKKGVHYFYEYDSEFNNRKIGLSGLPLDIISGDTLLYHFPNHGYNLQKAEIRKISPKFRKYLLSLSREEKKEKKLVDTAVGGRNNTLFKFLSGIQGNQNPDQKELEEAAFKWNNEQSNPLDEKEVLKVVESVAGRYESEGEKPKKKVFIDNDEFKYWYCANSEKFIQYSIEDDEIVLETSKSGFIQYTGLHPSAVVLPNLFHIFDFNKGRFEEKGKLKYFNEYKAPKWLGLKNAEISHEKKALFDRYFLHLGCNDQQLSDYLQNWVAYLYHKGKSPKTAILLRGIQGTGKGTLFNMLGHLFSKRYIKRLDYDLIASGWNDFLDKNRVLFVDEMPEDENDLKKFANKIKTWVTDDDQQINGKHQKIYHAEITAAFIIASNFDLKMNIEDSDRRWNILPYNENKIKSSFTTQELDYLNHACGEDLAKYLSNVIVDEEAAQLPIETDAKNILKQDSATTTQLIANALIYKDIYFFDEHLTNRNLLEEINQVFKNGKLTKDLMIEIFKDSGKQGGRYNLKYTIKRSLTRTNFYEFFNEKIFRINDGVKTKTVRGFNWKNRTDYFCDVLGGEIVDVKTEDFQDVEPTELPF